MTTLTLSAHRLDVAACPRRLWYYQHAHGEGRAPAAVSPALAQGIAGHGALAIWRRGFAAESMTQSQQQQEYYIDRVFTAHPQPPDDYRTPAYLKEALLQYKAEHPELSQFDFEEVERTSVRPVGEVSVDRLEAQVRVEWHVRRDAVARSRLDGKLYLIDNKFVSRDEQASVTAAQNSRAFKGGIWSWQDEHPDKPIHGVIQRRTVIRKPLVGGKGKPPIPFNFAFPLDPPLLAADYFTPERLEEWRQGVLRKAVEILERDPADPTQWQMEEACCRHTYGCCDYLGVCVLPPGDRLAKLGSDAFKPSAERRDYEKEEG